MGAITKYSASTVDIPSVSIADVHNSRHLCCRQKSETTAAMPAIWWVSLLGRLGPEIGADFALSESLQRLHSV